MREYTKKPENQSHTLDSNPRTSRQAPISDILQAYKNGTLRREPVQRESIEDEELLQGKFDTAQREKIDEDELLQGKFESAPISEQHPIQREEKSNNTGLPDNLKTGVENLSGYNMDDVEVHYNSDKPTQLNALVYTRGTDVHVSPRQEKYLPHELGDVIQQMKGPVSPTAYLDSLPVNDDPQLEGEADSYAGAIQMKKHSSLSDNCIGRTMPKNNVVQKKHINDVVNFLKFENESDMRVKIKLPTNKDNPPPIEHSYILKLYTIDADDNPTDDINKVREKISAIGQVASKENILTTLAGEKYFPVDKAQDKIDQHALYAPFIARIKNYGVQNEKFNKITMDVLFAKEGYGYVVKINDNKMKNREKAGEPQPQVGYMDATRKDWAADDDFKKTDYSRGHQEGDNLLSKSPSDFLVDNNAENADNITKIVGEGSRWIAVAELSDQGNLKDSSIFYVNSNDVNAKPPQIIFSKLWRTWAKKPFLNKFGISKEELKDALNNGMNNGMKNFMTKNDDCKTMNQLAESNENYNLG